MRLWLADWMKDIAWRLELSADPENIYETDLEIRAKMERDLERRRITFIYTGAAVFEARRQLRRRLDPRRLLDRYARNVFMDMKINEREAGR